MTETNEPETNPSECDTTCPRCGRDDNVDNLGDGERLWCSRCQYDWVPKSEHSEPPPEYEHYTFTDDDGCPQESANVRLRGGDDVVNYDEAWRRHNAHPAVVELADLRKSLNQYNPHCGHMANVEVCDACEVQKVLRESAAKLCVGCREMGHPEKHSFGYWHAWDDNDNGPEGRRCEAEFIWAILDPEAGAGPATSSGEPSGSSDGPASASTTSAAAGESTDD